MEYNSFLQALEEEEIFSFLYRYTVYLQGRITGSSFEAINGSLILLRVRLAFLMIS